jgi:hypothetical protein
MPNVVKNIEFAFDALAISRQSVAISIVALYSHGELLGHVEGSFCLVSWVWLTPSLGVYFQAWIDFLNGRLCHAACHYH